MDDTLYWIALRDVNGIGDITFKKLISEFRTPQNVFMAEKKDLLRIEGVGKALADEIKAYDNWDELQKVCIKINKIGCRLIKYNSEDYPENLRHIYNPPSFFYQKGEITSDDNRCMAVVGSRSPDRYGINVTDRLVRDLVENGFTIVSGLAKGIDTAAHKSAIKYGGRTIAVLGSGLDYIYPYENRNLYHEIIRNGAVISEFDPGTKPESGNFPRRNRVISGLALGVLVVQATENSGSLITADFALEQNREVFAVPGYITSSLSMGANRLIQKGAKLVTDVNDILLEVGNLNEGNNADIKGKNVTEFHELTEEELIIYRNLGEKPVHIDQLIDRTNMNTSKVLSLLLDLELKDMVNQLPGKFYQINN